ncbi:GTP cyclohydrolase FolE2 [Larsenimonas rhizosphaerae]|uniref:GTP cyclohydrolase FolE2 n=1 Tax=Larsenimonas rhizosphaerae TaxID=2944682 RepID=A0AA41ZF44_9GAMM|nr:GTP cyclohydrolase FolE2 [Larsenimonas rhizosphaerae]MCX2524079.1 GTP cyclohydrolase FolE2 [Larsenimonas rhizosphaerae]
MTDLASPNASALDARDGLSDVTRGPSRLTGALSRVGMAGIELPLLLDDTAFDVRVDAGVSLDDEHARGIHMSRLYLGLDALTRRPLTLARLDETLAGFLESHDGLSDTAYLDLTGTPLLRRPALISDHSGWKGYPLTLRTRRSPRGFEAQLELDIGYSSTCPCSAALARQLIQRHFDERFGDASGLTPEAVRNWLGSEDGIIATPHSQRSRAHLRLRLDPGHARLPWQDVIERSEVALGTALQTAVKRVDEQAFALANGQNLMFCEDAARRLHDTLTTQPGVTGFRLDITHMESLHAHDAVATAQWHWPGSL